MKRGLTAAWTEGHACPEGQAGSARLSTTIAVNLPRCRSAVRQIRVATHCRASSRAKGETLKKSTGKFQLHRETLRRLEAADLNHLAGGIKATGVPTACDADSTCPLQCRATLPTMNSLCC
jgi:hypothetical protein